MSSSTWARRSTPLFTAASLSHRFQAAFRTVIPPSCQQQHSHNHSPGPSVQRNIFLTECHLVELTEDLGSQFPCQLSVLSSHLPTALSITGQAPERNSQRVDIPVWFCTLEGRVMSHNLCLLMDIGDKMTLETSYPIQGFPQRMWKLLLKSWFKTQNLLIFS